jgi:hypothetical protein
MHSIFSGRLEGRKVIPVNLRGEVTEKAFKIVSNKIALDVTGYKPYSFVLI